MASPIAIPGVATTPAVQLEGVTKRFVVSGRNRKPLYRELLGWSSSSDSRPSMLALDRVDLAIPKGARVALVGSNGAGKTTLLRTIAGIYHPDEGTRRVAGRVACFFEAGAGVAPVLSVVDNVFVYGAVLGLTHRECEAALDEIIHFAELDDHRESRVEHLSFGMQQRLFFSVILTTMRLDKAEVYLFDEWLGGADFRFKQKGEDALVAAPSGDAVVFFASHELERLESICDLGIYLQNGCIRDFGPAKDVIASYRAAEAREDFDPESDSDDHGDVPS